jgi:predicted transposase/invertase (TIGR01784 family)
MKHDEGYRKIMSDKDSFLHFLNKYIRASWIDGITVDDLEQINTTYIDDDYLKRESDIIYKIESKNVFFYTLLELQSEPDFSMPFRLLKYMVNLLDDIFKNTDENKRTAKPFKLPAIVPIVLFNGEGNWTPVMSFKEYTSNHGVFGNNIIDFKYILFDLNRYNEEDILTTYKLLDFVFTLDMKHYSRSVSDSDEALKKLIKLPHELTDADIKEFIQWIKYARFGGNIDENLLNEAITAFKKGEVETMSYAMGRAMERERESLRKGEKTEIAQRMLKKGKPIEEIIEFTDLTRKEIEELIA